MRIHTFLPCTILAAGILFLSMPLVAIGAETGHDWYCPEEESHKQYVKHLKQYHKHDSAEIADRIAEIYSKKDLSEAEKRAETVKTIDRYLHYLDLGQGD